MSAAAIASVTSLPVSAYLENRFGDPSDGTAKTIRRRPVWEAAMAPSLLI